MKKANLILITFFIFSFCHLKAQTAHEHLAEIGKYIDPISKDVWDYIRVSNRSNNVKRSERKRQELIATMKTSKYKISRVKSFGGDVAYREATEKYLSFEMLVIQDKYDQIINLEAVANDSYDFMEAYITAKELVNEKMDSAYGAYMRSFDKFASDNNINIIDNNSKLSDKIKYANKVISYYNDFNLAAFRGSFYEKEYLDALSSKEVGKIEQSRMALEDITQEEMIKIAELDGFENDNSVKKACYDWLYFLHSEAKKYGPDHVNFFMMTLEVEEQTKLMNSKNSKQLTKEEVDKYNELINTYNSKLNEFNKTTEYINKFRESRFDTWQKASGKFLNKV